MNQNYKKYVDAVIDGIKETYGLGGLSNTYTVQNGDSLWKIANKFGTTINTLKSLNNITNDNLRVGQILVIPSTNTGTIIRLKMETVCGKLQTNMA